MCCSLPVCYLDNGSRGFNAPRASSHPHGNVGLWVFVRQLQGCAAALRKHCLASLPVWSGRRCVPHQGYPGLAVQVLPWVLQPLTGSVCPTASRNMEATS